MRLQFLKFCLWPIDCPIQGISFFLPFDTIIIDGYLDRFQLIKQSIEKRSNKKKNKKKKPHATSANKIKSRINFNKFILNVFFLSLSRSRPPHTLVIAVVIIPGLLLFPLRSFHFCKIYHHLSLSPMVQGLNSF